MPWDGVERRKPVVPATRRFVLALATVVLIYVSGVFVLLQINGHRDSERVRENAQRQYINDLASCDRGDDIRRALNKMGAGLDTGTCRERVKRP